MTRMFVAALPPAGVAEDLDEFLAVRREATSHDRAFRWSDPAQWHLTLAFLADVPDRALDDLVERLGRAAKKRRPMELAIAGGGAFPHPDRAKVLYAALAASGDDRTEADLTELGRLATGCRAAATKAGAPVDGQRFRAHLTLARLGRPGNVTSWVRLLDGYHGPAWQLDDIALVASYLGEGPRKRPRHEVVDAFPLGG